MASDVVVADHLDAVIANVPGVIYRCLLDADWSMVFVSDGIERLSGYPAADFLGHRRSFASIIHPDDRAHVEELVTSAVAAGEAFAPEYRIIRADDSVRWVLERGRASRDASGGRPWLDGAIFDISDRKVLEEEVRRAIAEESVNQERLRLATDLHDAVGHALSIGVIQAGGARRVLHTDPDAAEHAVQAIEEALRSAMGEMRAMVAVLHGEESGDHGGRRRLEDLLPNASRSGLTVDLEVVGEPRSLPAAVEVSLYRTVQECLTNCVKYASGATVSLRLVYRPGAVSLTVTDDGSGCVEPATRAHTGGSGLDGLRWRAASLGGTCEAGPLRSGGFEVAVGYPA